MGSAKEPEALQSLKKEVAPEDVHQPNTSLPCSQEKGSCLQNTKCDGGELTMRNCCVNDLGTKDSCQEDTMVDNPSQKKAPAVDAPPSKDLAAATGTVALKDTGNEKSPLEGLGGTEAISDLCHNSEQRSSMKELPSSSTNTCTPLEGKYSGKASPAAEKRNAEEACRPLPAESCLKGANKDSSSAPASMKHVAFLEPTKNKDEPGSVRTGMVPSELGPDLTTCLQKTSQGQLDVSKGDLCKLKGASCEAEEHVNEGQRDTLVQEASKESVSEPTGADTAPGKLGKSGAEMNPLGPTAGMRPPVIKVNTGVGSSGVSETLTAAAAVTAHEIKYQSTSGDTETTPGQATQETEGLREASPSSPEGNNRAQEQQKSVVTSTSTNEGHVSGVETESVEPLPKVCSFEITAPQQDAGTQVDNRVSLVSVAISPINPPDGSTAFTFHARGLAPLSSLKSPGPEQKPTKKDVEMQVFIPVETRSVATGPMTPVTKSPQASYPEVHVKGAQEEASEPVREVSWDEKGMTWEVYGASMEVEVLGMAIQKHLEKQIEEHGRQIVMTPQSTRASSIKGAPRKGEIKRQPSVFRALLQNVRRPHCCSRGGPAVE
ncbi:G protein-regulated inducer of neurite outgrowth 1 [Sphaerodactylus townsendi]|uniref:Uncharacterized protein n=1 Tax=Sphaerodactylus townsendi TaxID=933632 RepID=A0ACB8EIA9_9SAUR|nr:G protein-regulated inducer of neurite outgrowth 1 [Sphaerodactylus townsendi]